MTRVGLWRSGRGVGLWDDRCIRLGKRGGIACALHCIAGRLHGVENEHELDGFASGYTMG